jgi:hypothetical protein
MVNWEFTFVPVHVAGIRLRVYSPHLWVSLLPERIWAVRFAPRVVRGRLARRLVALAIRRARNEKNEVVREDRDRGE